KRLGILLVHNGCSQTLVLGVDIRVQKAADHGFEASSLALPYYLAHRLDVQRLQHSPLSVQAFAYAKAPAAWHQWPRLGQVTVIEASPHLPPNFQDIAEPLSRHHPQPGHLALDEGIGRDRRRMHHQAYRLSPNVASL